MFRNLVGMCSGAVMSWNLENDQFDMGGDKKVQLGGERRTLLVFWKSLETKEGMEIVVRRMREEKKYVKRNAAFL